MIAETDRLGRAAARAGDLVPALDQRHAGRPGHRVYVHDCARVPSWARSTGCRRWRGRITDGSAVPGRCAAAPSSCGHRQVGGQLFIAGTRAPRPPGGLRWHHGHARDDQGGTSWSADVSEPCMPISADSRGSACVATTADGPAGAAITSPIRAPGARVPRAEPAVGDRLVAGRDPGPRAEGLAPRGEHVGRGAGLGVHMPGPGLAAEQGHPLAQLGQLESASIRSCGETSTMP